MIFFILFCIITGIAIINLFCEKINLLKLLILVFPVGVAFHTIIFSILSFINIYYNKYLFISISIITLITFIKKRVKIINDLKQIPIYYILILGYILYRLFIMADSGFFEFYNYDEFTAYQTGSTIIYLSHSFREMYITFAPLNFFIGVMSLEFVGFSLTAVRTVSVIFFGLISLFIFYALRENKVNKNISALLAILFLISSSEILQLAKAFYTNIFFMAYFTMGVYGVLHYYFIEKQRGIPCLYFLLMIGTLLTRKDAFFLTILIIILISIIMYIKKKISKKELIILNSPILYYIIWSILRKINLKSINITHIENTDTIINRVFTRLSGTNIYSFLKNGYIQLFSKDYYFYNSLIFILLIVTIIVFMYKFITKKDKKYIYFSFFTLMFEAIYIGIVFASQLIVFTKSEYLQAASLSRYLISVMAINFILFGCLLYNNTDNLRKEKEPRKKECIEKPKILLIIPMYNSKCQIINIISKIKEYNKNNDIIYDYIVVSNKFKIKDDSIEENLVANDINHIELINNLNVFAMLQVGYKYAFEKKYDIIVQIDDKEECNINDIKNMIQPIIKDEVDMVINKRKKISIIEKSNNILNFYLLKYITQIKVYDSSSEFRAINKKIIKEYLKEYPSKNSKLSFLIKVLKKGYLIKEI